jgi:hypothetical protein
MLGSFFQVGFSKTLQNRGIFAAFALERNPGYVGAVQPVIKEDAVTGLTFPADAQLVDIAPIQPLTSLVSLTLRQTGVADLTPLASLPLVFLDCRQTRVTDFTPLGKMPLKVCYADFQDGRDAAILHSIKTLERINDKPAAQFWKEVNAKKP